MLLWEDKQEQDALQGRRETIFCNKKLFFSNLTSQELLKSSKKKVIPSQEWVILSQDWVIPRQDLVNSSQCKFKWIIYNSQFIHGFYLKLYSWKLDELESNLINETQKEIRSQFCKLTLTCRSDREEKFTWCWTIGIEKFTSWRTVGIQPGI